MIETLNREPNYWSIENSNWARENFGLTFYLMEQSPRRCFALHTWRCEDSHLMLCMFCLFRFRFVSQNLQPLCVRCRQTPHGCALKNQQQHKMQKLKNTHSCLYIHIYIFKMEACWFVERICNLHLCIPVFIQYLY